MKIEILKQIGGSEWKKDGKHRVYFNDLGKWYGIETERYNTGNICGATFRGKRMSNSQAKKELSKLMDCKVWYDATDGKFYRKGPEYIIENLRYIISQIKAAAAKAEQIA